MLKTICERHLIAEDPYQFEDLSTDQLVSVFWVLRNQKSTSGALVNEMLRRLMEKNLSDDDREILRKTLQNK